MANKNSKCIILSRVSTEQQDLIQQTENVKNEALRQGYSPENIIIIEDKESAVKLSEEEIKSLQNEKRQYGLEISDKNSQLTKLRNRKRINYDNLTYDEKISIIKDVIKVIYVSRISYVEILLKVHNNYNDRIDEIIYKYTRGSDKGQK